MIIVAGAAAMNFLKIIYNSKLQIPKATEKRIFKRYVIE